MVEKKKRRAKSEESSELDHKDEHIASYLRFNCPTNSTIFEGNEVHYFSAKKAVDTLLSSKEFGINAKKPVFTTSAAAEACLRHLLELEFFFRVKKIVLKKKDKYKLEGVKEKKKDSKPHKSPKPKKSNDEVKEKDDAKENDGEEEKEGDEDKESEEHQEEGKKKKKKVKLFVHEQQSFIVNDTSDAYVWIFDPTPFYKKVIGFLIVLGTIAGCLFPLWPDWLRLIIYYLSVSGIGLFGVFLGLIFVRAILFGVLWGVTLGRHKLWIFPNLLEDCGFCESFVPLYSYENSSDARCGSNIEETDGKKKKKSSITIASTSSKKNESGDAKGEPTQRHDDKDEEELQSLNEDTSLIKKSEDENKQKKRRSQKSRGGSTTASNESEDDEENSDESRSTIVDEISSGSDNEKALERNINESERKECGGEEQTRRRKNVKKHVDGHINQQNRKDSGSSTHNSPSPGCCDDDFVIIDNQHSP